MLGRIGFVVSQLQSKGKEDSLTLSFDELLSTLGDVEGMSFNIEQLKSRVIALRAKRISCVNKAKETKSAIEVHNTLITLLQESMVKLQEDLSSVQEANSTLQTQLEGVTAEQSSLDKAIEKLECELGALSHLDFSLDNISTLIDIV